MSWYINPDKQLGLQVILFKEGKLYGLYMTLSEKLYTVSFLNTSVDRTQIIVSFKAEPPTPGHESGRVFNLPGEDLMNGIWIVYELVDAAEEKTEETKTNVYHQPPNLNHDHKQNPRQDLLDSWTWPNEIL